MVAEKLCGRKAKYGEGPVIYSKHWVGARAAALLCDMSCPMVDVAFYRFKEYEEQAYAKIVWLRAKKKKFQTINA